ncbi:MAG TPA: hypothetical protein VLA34_06445, partial [Candidatus Krumholzibacterium sp.]|nr:hypothetical protein [Candidatus Krumholzibacterium sp.]
AELSGGSIPEWGEAFSNMRRGIIVIDSGSVTRTPRPLETVIRHELSHIVLAQKVRGARLPTWFVEGLAMRQSREWTLIDQWRLMTAIWSGGLPDLEDLEDGFPVPAATASAAYNLSYAAVDRLLEERPEDLLTLLSFTRDLGDFDRAFLLTFGRDKYDFTETFHLDLQKRYGRAIPLLRSPPFWLILTAMFILAYILKRIRSARKLREWEEDGA